MMYSNVDILRAIANKEITIDPYIPEQIKAAGLLFHLGDTLLKPKIGTVIDVKNKIVPEFEKIIITEDQPYCLKAGEFVLGHTFEKVSVGSSLGFFIEGRSTLARVGLTVVQTAMMVYPGHTGRAITLELANHGGNPILLYPKMKIARAAMIELKSPSTIVYDEQGKYREQDIVGPPVFDQEFGKF
jgi:dCTP deaminase